MVSTMLKCHTQSRVPPLIHVGAFGEEDDDGGNSHQAGGPDLLEDIALGLLTPRVPLSIQAARKLQGSCPGQQQSAGCQLKSLPTQLLYDDTGLELFDQITYLPEYYLTEAEASILAKSGQDIVRSCVMDGSCIIELGAGSMRKTKLLLDAVEAAGRHDVTFAALDLCEDSLSQALSALQGRHSSSSSGMRLVGLVGTYDQGLQYIWQQQQAKLLQQKQQQQQYGAAAPAGPEDDSAPCNSGDSSSPGGSHTAMDGFNSLGGDSGDSVDTSSIDAAIHFAEAPDAQGKLCRMEYDGSKEAGLVLGDSPTVIMWLGSSIGNCSREEAADFLQQVKAKAMRPGDFLLLGVDRRNASSMVAAAYNDHQGITRKFILNGLQHCSRLLDAALQQDAGSSPNNDSAACDTPTHQPSSLNPADFDYFCLYNETLGRHEAYYQAKVDSTITLPGTAAVLTGTTSRNAGTGTTAGRVAVPIAAGELISVEFSYKYSQQEVEQLAAAAGLVRVQAWSDSLQHYDLHLLKCMG